MPQHAIFAVMQSPADKDRQFTELMLEAAGLTAKPTRVVEGRPSTASYLTGKRKSNKNCSHTFKEYESDSN